MIGDESITEAIRKYCSTWYQYMVALLLYTDPTVKSYDLSYHAQQCINAYGGQERLKLLDVLILALLESDLQQVIVKKNLPLIKIYNHLEIGHQDLWFLLPR